MRMENIRLQENGIDANSKFVLCSSNRAHFDWLDRALDEWHIRQQALTSVDTLVAQLEACRPRLLLLDFSDDCGIETDCIAIMTALAQRLKTLLPEMHLVAVGTMDHTDGAIAALRAGVHHFIDMHGAPEEARSVIRTIIAAPEPKEAADPCTLVALVGARIGVGTTTLAAHMADLLQRRKTPQQTEMRIGLLDLGLPAGDGQLYLNATGAFHIAEAIRNRHRLDHTLIQTALPRTATGVRIVSLPRASQEIAGIAATDAVALLAQLRPHFDVLIVDLGGFPNTAFVADIAKAADRTWLVTDQSVGALVSLAALLKELDAHNVGDRRRELIVNRYDSRYGMDADRIAARFDLPLKAVLPECALRMLSAANLGKLLHETARSDPYARAVQKLGDGLLESDADRRTASGGLSRWVRRWMPADKNKKGTT